MRRKLVNVLLSTVLVASLLVGCGNKPSSTTESTADASKEETTEETTVETEEETAKGGLKLGYITPGPDTWYQRDVEGFQMGAEADGNEVIVLNSDYDSSKEIANIESLINQEVDGICIFSFNETGAQICVEKAAEAGIPVVATDSCGTVFNTDAKAVAAIDFDWNEMGTNYAEWMADNHAGEDYVIITGNFESVPCQMVNKAMTEKSEELGKNTCIEIKEGSYDPSKAINVAQDLISSGKEFSIIFVMNEDMAAGVIQMLEQNDLLDKYTVIAQNGSPAGLDLIENGKLSYTISSSPGWEGLVSYAALDNYITGKNTATEQNILLPVMPVNQENINDSSKVVPWECNDIYWDLMTEYFPDMID